MQYLKANTQTIVTIGPFVDISDGLTPETTVALSTADEAELIKHGSTTVVSLAAATWAAVTSMDGYYSLTLTTSHTDTEGQITIAVNDDSLCLPVIARFQVLAEAAYDSLFVAKDSGLMDVNVSAVGDTTQTAGDLQALITTVDTVVDGIVTTLGVAGAGLTAVVWNAAWDAEVQSECTDALNAYDPPTKAELDTAVAGVTVTTISDGAVDATVVADIFSTTALTEAYAADGAAGTAAELLYLIQQSLTEFAISSTTITAKKLDGSTTAATFSMDDATTPTSRTRAT